MELPYPTFRNNEFHCLTHAISKGCVFAHLPSTAGVVPHVRDVITKNGIDLKNVLAVTYHQCPKPNRRVLYTVTVHAKVDGCYTEFETPFEGIALDKRHMDCTLYDRDSDGALAFLHLQH